jgi:GT2 family glycosyltransferase
MVEQQHRSFVFPHRRPSVSVVVPLLNGGEPFLECLRNLSALDPAPLEILIVSDGDHSGSAETARRLGFTVISLPRTCGPARARNRGAAQAVGEILVFIDADVRVPSDLISRIASVFQDDPSLAALIGSYDDEPGAPNFVAQYKNLSHHYVHQMSSEDASTFWGACGAMRRDIFMQVRGFDERYRRPSVEDIELGYRLKQNGHRIRLCKDVQVTHLKRWELRSMWQADIHDRAIPWTKLMWRYRACRNDLNTRTTDRLSAVTTYIGITALASAAVYPESLAISLLSAGILTALNGHFYNFLAEKRGWRFMLRAIPLHWMYFLYSGAAFALATLSHWCETLVPETTPCHVPAVLDGRKSEIKERSA